MTKVTKKHKNPCSWFLYLLNTLTNVVCFHKNMKLFCLKVKYLISTCLKRFKAIFQNQIVELHALQKGKSREKWDFCGYMVHIFQATWKIYGMWFNKKKDCTYNLQLGQKIFLDVPFDSQSLLSALFTFTQRAADSKACAFLLSAVSARMPLAVRSVIRSSMDHNEKLHASTKSNRDSIYWNPCGDSVSLAYKQWVWFSECYPYVTPPTHEPITCSFFHSTKPLNPPLPITSTPFPSPLAPAAVNSRIPVCDSVHPSLFSPALTTPSLHPFLSCVLCCQAQLDQACQSSQMQSLLVLKQAVLNPCLARPFMSVAFM